MDAAVFPVRFTGEMVVIYYQKPGVLVITQRRSKGNSVKLSTQEKHLSGDQ